MALPGTGEEGRGEMLREPREPAAGGVEGEAQRHLMLDFQPRERMRGSGEVGGDCSRGWKI